jgi:hypothetical protein
MHNLARRNRAFLLVVVVVGIGLGSIPAAAQLATGSIQGLVSDASGAVVPGATVTAADPANGFSRTTTSNNDGLYEFPTLPPGNYTITSEAKGFAKQVAESVSLQVNAQLTINFTLKTGATSETVTVTEAAPLVDAVSSTVAPVIPEKTIVDLPLNGRDWGQLATLEPGVAPVRTQPPVSVSNQRANRGVGNQLTVSGARPQVNNYRLDGISINDYSNGGPGGVTGTNLGVDSIREFSVITANPGADVGKTAGGVINAVTRSGSNQWHGTGYEFLRNSAFDARNEFDQPGQIAEFRRNQFGGSVGGPIIKNKLFIFGNYEGLYQYQGANVSSVVPSPAARQGNLVAGHVNVSPLVQPYLQFYPLPNSTITGDTGIFLFNNPLTTHENYFTIRGDWNINSKDTFGATYFYDNGSLVAPDPFDVKVTGNYDYRQMAGLNETHVFASNLINTVRFGYSRVVSIAPTTVAINNPAASDPAYGFVPGLPVGLINIGGISNFQGGKGAVGEFDFHYNSYQVYDDVSWTKGKHSVSFGFAFERLQNNQLGTANPNGQYTFSSLTTFLTNRPSTFNAPISSVISPKDLRQSVYGYYINDDWRVRPNLTLNLGLRYEPASVPWVVGNQISNLRVLTAPQPVLGAPYFQNNTHHDFAPRVGFSWDPYGDGQTVVRAAYGIYDALPLNYLFEGLSLFAAPFFQQGSVASLAPGTFPTGAYPLLKGNNLRYSFNQFDPGRSYVQQWNLNVQHQLPGEAVFQIGYFGTHGVHLPYRLDDANTVLPTTIVDNNYFFPVPRGSGTRLNPAVGQISALYFTNSATYNALQVGLTKHLSHNWLGNISYTWGRSIDYGSSSTFGDTFANSISSLPLWAPPRRKGPSDFNISQNFVANVVYNLPIYHSAKAWIISNWQIGAIVQIATGLPFSPLISGDPLGLNSADPFDFPNRVTTGACTGNPVNPQNRSHYIKTECFTFPTPGTELGSAGRNSIIGPGLRNADITLMKNNKVTERFSVQFRTDFFNIFNFVNYATPVKASTQLFTQAGAPISSAGTLTQTSTSSRQVQFAIRLMF